MKYYDVKLNEEQYTFFQKWIKEQVEIEKSNSIEELVKRAKHAKKIAKELYPDKEFKCSVNVKTKIINFEVVEDDRFLRNALTAKMILEIEKKIKNIEEESPREEHVIYV